MSGNIEHEDGWINISKITKHGFKNTFMPLNLKIMAYFNKFFLFIQSKYYDKTEMTNLNSSKDLVVEMLFIPPKKIIIMKIVRLGKS